MAVWMCGVNEKYRNREKVRDSKMVEEKKWLSGARKERRCPPSD